MRVGVAGAGGAIGGHLVKALLDQGHEVRAADIKRGDWWQWHAGAVNMPMHDLSNPSHAENFMEGCDWVYDLAEHMGGISFIESNKVECAESIEIGITLLRTAIKTGVRRFFFASSACVYPTGIQRHAAPGGLIKALKEYDAWPAQPEEGYGFSKLYMEELCRHYSSTYGIETRVARYHNIFGSPGSWNDGKEKSPAALCRKVAEAVYLGDDSIEIWGDGRQVRSYLHVSDCVRGTIGLMESEYRRPVNIGSNRAVTVNQLVSMIEAEAGTALGRTYNMKGAQGVGVRNADITLAHLALGWEPETALEEGLAELYRWISSQVSDGASNGHKRFLQSTTEVSD